MNKATKFKEIHKHLLAAILIAEELKADDLAFDIEGTIFNKLFPYGDTDSWGPVSELEVLNLIHGPNY